MEAPAVMRKTLFHCLVDVDAYILEELAAFRKLGLCRLVQRRENEGENEPARRRTAEQENALPGERPHDVHSYRGDQASRSQRPPAIILSSKRCAAGSDV